MGSGAIVPANVTRCRMPSPPNAPRNKSGGCSFGMTATAADKPRDQRIDSLRGIAIVAVVVGHVLLRVYPAIGVAPVQWSVLFTVLTSFHVQLFAFLSGYLAKAPTSVSAAGRWIGSRVTRLLLPYAAWTVVFWAGFGSRGRSGLSGLLNMLLYPGEGAQTAMWFLAALFMASVVFALFAWNEPLLVAVTVVLALWPVEWAFLDFNLAQRLLPFFVAGFLARRYGWRTGWWAPPLYVITLALMWSDNGVNMLYPAPTWALTVNEAIGDSWMLGGTMLVRMLRVVMPLAAIATLFLIARRWQPLADWGRRSLGVYAAHQLFLGFGIGSGIVLLASKLVGTLGGAWLTSELLAQWWGTALVFLGQARKKPPAAVPESQA